MKTINYISELTSIDSKYIILIIRTFIFFFILFIIKRIGIKIIKHIKDTKKEYIYTQRYKLIISIVKLIIFIFLWGNI